MAQLAGALAFSRLTCSGASYASSFHDLMVTEHIVTVLKWLQTTSYTGTEQRQNGVFLVLNDSRNFRVGALLSSSVLPLKYFWAFPKLFSIIREISGVWSRNDGEAW